MTSWHDELGIDHVFDRDRGQELGELRDLLGGTERPVQTLTTPRRPGAGAASRR